MSKRLNALLERFPVTSRLGPDLSGPTADPVFREFFDEFGGATLGGGFYRFHTAVTSQVSDAACAGLISGFAGRMRCFAVDWLGREIAADVRPGRRQKVIIVDPGGGEHLTTPCDLDDWHDAVADPELDPLAWPFYAAWREVNPAFGELGFDQAIGYRVPLFLGGEDQVTNLEATPRELYFDICTQLRLGTLDLAPGTTIEQIRVQR
jgi:hypothetical protein